MRLLEIKTFWTGAAAAAALFGATLGAPQTASAAVVDTQLQLLIDVSGSVDSTEFALQREGYARAFEDTDIQNFILSTVDGDGNARQGALGVQAIYWSSSNQQQVGVGWSLIDSITDANQFAADLRAAARPFSGLTAPGSAITFGVNQFTNNGFTGGSKVIDVSGDGSENDGADTRTAANAAVATGGIDRINGLAILGSEGGLEAWYNDNIKTGLGAFVIASNGFGDFNDAIKQKLTFEITGTTPTIPLPAPFLLLIGGIAGLGFVSRKRKAA